VPEKNVQFHAYWVSRFISFCNRNENLVADEKIAVFLESLSLDETIKDWQFRQAETALKLYTANFLKGDKALIDLNHSNAKQSEYSDFNSVVNKLRDMLRLKHYSYSTEQTYIEWAKRFYAYILSVKKEKEIGRLDSADVTNYLTYLAVKQKISSSTQNQAFNALLFLFKNVLHVELVNMEDTVRAKRGQKLPVVLTVGEVQELFKHVKGRNLLIIQLIYGSGIRLMELARLRVKDIDFGSNLLFVRSGKGDKDRSTILPEFVKTELKLHLDKVKTLHDEDLRNGHGEVYLPNALDRKYPNAPKDWGWQYVFPSEKLSVDPRSSKIRRHHLSDKAIQNIVKEASKKAGIVKNASVHTLRHSFATHLLMNGVNIREIQDLLGHKNLETTMIYTHVMRDMSNAPRSPLDKLYKGAGS
jgi:integron integrase